MCPALTILIPAAGRSARMRGRDKLMEPVAGVPLLRRQVGLALTLGVPVFVTLPCGKTARRDSLLDLPSPRLSLHPLPGAEEGMSASLRAGAAHGMKTGADAMMILLPDLPGLTEADLSLMSRRFAEDPARVLRATDAHGQPGHPVILPRRVLPDVTRLTGDRGARALFEDHVPRLCPLPGDRATRDLDTPEAWQAWRADQAE